MIELLESLVYCLVLIGFTTALGVVVLGICLHRIALALEKEEIDKEPLWSWRYEARETDDNE